MGNRGYVHKVSRFARRWRSVNVRPFERWISVAAGLGVAALALRPWKRRTLGALAAALLLRRGLTGDCPLYRKMGLSSS
jgi:hypothetical protein